MEPLFNNLRSITLRLKKGLHTPNPDNPKRPMWEIEDLDQIMSKKWKHTMTNPYSVEERFVLVLLNKKLEAPIKRYQDGIII